MEGLSTHVYKGIKKYINTRGYVRLHNPNPNPNPNKTKIRTHIKLGQQHTTTRKRRRIWRVKISPRLKIWMRVGSPKKWLTRLRDAYVNMMLKISNSGLVSGGTAFGGSGHYGLGFEYGKGQLKEYDEKMIVEFYKSFVIAQGQLATNGNGNGNGKICGSRNNIISISTR